MAGSDFCCINTLLDLERLPGEPISTEVKAALVREKGERAEALGHAHQLARVLSGWQGGVWAQAGQGKGVLKCGPPQQAWYSRTSALDLRGLRGLRGLPSWRVGVPGAPGSLGCTLVLHRADACRPFQALPFSSLQVPHFKAHPKWDPFPTAAFVLPRGFRPPFLPHASQPPHGATGNMNQLCQLPGKSPV